MVVHNSSSTNIRTIVFGDLDNFVRTVNFINSFLINDVIMKTTIRKQKSKIAKFFVFDNKETKSICNIFSRKVSMMLLHTTEEIQPTKAMIPFRALFCRENSSITKKLNKTIAITGQVVSYNKYVRSKSKINMKILCQRFMLSISGFEKAINPISALKKISNNI